MDIDLVKDLIKSRREHLILNLSFYFGRTTAQIYPDYKMESLESSDIKQYLMSCSRAELEILKTTTTKLKIEALTCLLQLKYDMRCSTAELPDRYHIALCIKNK